MDVYSLQDPTYRNHLQYSKRHATKTILSAVQVKWWSWFPKSQKGNSPGICLVPQLHNCGDGNGVEYKWNQNEKCLTKLENTKLKCLAFHPGGNWRKANFQNSACLFKNTPNKVWICFSFQLNYFHSFSYICQWILELICLMHYKNYSNACMFICSCNLYFADSSSWSQSFLNILLRFCLTFLSPF